MARPRFSQLLGGDKGSTFGGQAGSRSSSPSWLLQALRSGAPGQWSQNLNELSRHFTSAAFLAVNTLATQASGSAFQIFERTDDPQVPDGKRQLPWTDPIHQRFESPNDQDTFPDLLYQTVQQLSLTGISLTWAPPSGDGDIAEIYNLPSCTAWPLPISPEYPRGAYRVIPYPYGMYGTAVGSVAAGAIIPAEQVKRVKNHHPILRYDGYAVLTAISLHVDTLEGIDKARYAAQKQGCEQTTALELDKDSLNPDESDIKRIREQIQAIYMGPENAGKIFITPPGGKLSRISTIPSEMAWTEGWTQILDFVLAAFGVPQAVAGLQANLSYATLYSSLRAFSYLSLGPVLGRVSGGWNKHLIRPTYGNEFGLEIFPPEFKDEALEEQKLANDMKGGIRLVREIRRMRGLDHLDESWVNERAWAQGQPGNNAPEGGRDNQPESSGDREEDPAVNNARPPAAGKAIRDQLAQAFEHHKTNGTIKPIKE